MQDASEYVVSERNALRNRQTELDKKAVGLEKQLRQAMKAGNLQREEILMQNWFALITEKNGLERREQELNLLEQEENLERRHELLKRELRKISTLEGISVQMKGRVCRLWSFFHCLTCVFLVSW
jgi:hypothetical protein